MQVGDFRLQCLRIIYVLYSLQVRLQRLNARRLDGRLVHATRIKIANLLPVRARRAALVRRSFVQDPAQHILVVFTKFIERAPRRISRGNRMALHPAAVGKLKEIIARRNRTIQIRQIESMPALLVGNAGHVAASSLRTSLRNGRNILARVSALRRQPRRRNHNQNAQQNERSASNHRIPSFSWI